VILLLALTHDQLADVMAPGLGRLLGPRLRSAPAATAAAGWPWAADNDAFSAWDERRYTAMLDAITGLPGCLFVTCPDVVGDHRATMRRFWDHWLDLRDRGLPIAFVAQDGVSIEEVPWDEIASVFLGGTDTFKLGPCGRVIAAEARRRGHWLHMGRVNSHRRMRYAHALGCDSIDGTNWARWNDAHLADGKRWRAATVDQLLLDLGDA
jgi:hypothetical protein